VHLEASTKPPIHNLIHEFFINVVFTMACPNFKKGLKMAFGPLGANHSKPQNGNKYFLAPFLPPFFSTIVGYGIVGRFF
jgi:hypothetical protein